MPQALTSKNPLGEVVSDQPRWKKLPDLLSLGTAAAVTLLPRHHGGPRDEACCQRFAEVETADVTMRRSAAILVTSTSTERQRNQ